MFKKLGVEDRLQVYHEPEQEYYTAKVLDLDKEEMMISEPLSGGKTLEMPDHSSWQFYLNKEDAVYFFTSRVVGAKKEGSVTRYLVKRPHTAHRHQRRGHVRVPCHQDLHYWRWDELKPVNGIFPETMLQSKDFWEDPIWMRDYLKELEAAAPIKPAFSLDMSGGGLRMVSLEPLARYDRLLITTYIGEKGKQQLLLLEGKVVRVAPLNIGGWKRYRAGVSFMNIDPEIQEQIISYLFTLMRNKLEREV